ncbi:hypothetical protein C8J56DRAFT_1052584 [Mycena floridula]|nr:hypothetical protein C8J56DRAFT_1052584 [Mycena floridula]
MGGGEIWRQRRRAASNQVESQTTKAAETPIARSAFVSRLSRDRVQATHPYRSVAPPAGFDSEKFYYVGAYQSGIPYLVQDYYLPKALMRSLIDIPLATLYDPKIFERPNPSTCPDHIHEELWHQYMHDYECKDPEQLVSDDGVDYYVPLRWFGDRRTKE